MNFKLYNTNKVRLELVEALIENGGELTEELYNALPLNRENFEAAAVEEGFNLKQLKGYLTLISEEQDRIAALKKSVQRTIEVVENNLSVSMEIQDIEEIKTPLMKISFRKSESVEIDDVNLIDKKYINVKTTETPDKAAIKDAIKAGEIVIGAHISVNKNIQIK